MKQPRPYQLECVEKVIDALDYCDRVLYTMPTGTGKTITFTMLIKELLAQGKERILVLAHREELLDQACKSIREGCHLDIFECGVEQADRYAPAQAKVKIGSMQTVVNPNRLGGWRPQVIIHDECFPAGTLVDGKSIETLKAGDMIRSWNHNTNKVEMRPVVRLFRNKVSRLLKVTLEDGKQIVCTPEHPFFTESGYLPAYRLKSHNRVQCVIQQERGMTHERISEIHHPEDLRGVRHCLPAEIVERINDSYLLFGMQTGTKRIAQEGCNTSLYRLQVGSYLQRDKGSSVGAERQGFLFGGMQARIHVPEKAGNNGENKHEICFGSYESEQSHAQGRQQGSDEADAFRHKVPAEGSRRKRQRDYDPAEALVRGSWMENGGCNTHENGNGEWLSALLQIGHRKRRGENRNRSRRELPFMSISKGAGHEKGRISFGVRVACVEVLKQGSDGGYGALCPDGHVYNIEVEANHNYFVNDILVHNCHHARCETIKKIFTHYGAMTGECKVIGCTATALRGDKKALYARDVNGNDTQLIKGKSVDPDKFPYQQLVYELSIVDAIEAAWLTPLIGYRVQTKTDISDIGMVGDDFNQKQLQEKVNAAERTALAFEKWQQVAGNRSTICFTAGVQHAADACGYWKEQGITAAVVTGETEKTLRHSILTDFKSGKIQCVFNDAVLTEGFDAPNCSCIVCLKPTRSWNIYVQQVGRCLRPAEGVIDGLETPAERLAAIEACVKPDACIIDIVDITKGKNLCTVPSILQLPPDIDLQGKKLSELDLLLKAFDAEKVKKRVLEECPQTYDDIKAILETVNLLDRSGAKSNAKWKITGAGEYVYPHLPFGCTARLKQEEGKWTLEASGQGKTVRKSAPDVIGMSKILDFAENHLLETFKTPQPPPPVKIPTSARLSTKQMFVLQKGGFKQSDIDKWTYGYAKMKIGELMEDYHRRKGTDPQKNIYA